jgi:D-glycero-alpha-D-manno-heptose-7-phosphate kinase
MIVSKTPFRISFFGGGSDLPSFYNQTDGFVVSAAIDKYIYISFNRKFDDSIRLSYSVTENVDDVEDLKHDIVKHTLKFFDLTKSIELASISDLPSNGTGMGASSAFAVGLINALSKYRIPHQTISPKLLANFACQIEIDHCKKPIGKQDQFACAYGGFNSHRFTKNAVDTKPVFLRPDTLHYLEENLILLYTSKGRSADNILQNQSKNMEDNTNSFDTMKAMVDLAHQFHTKLERQDLSDFGEMLDYSWHLKKQITDGISNPELDEMYADAKQCGAKGGKVLGAGGGGFMLLYADKNAQLKIKEKFAKCKPFNFHFDFSGSTVLGV